jgi:hypothetical protein
MAYSNFTLDEVEARFGLDLQAGAFIPSLLPIAPSSWLQETLSLTLPLAKIAGSEKARSEFMIAPILVELRRLTHNEISIFSGEDFTVDRELGLNGTCDFMISKSPNQVKITAPIVALVEAKKGVLRDGWGQCIAEMVAAQRFNAQRSKGAEPDGGVSDCIYGIITSGTAWQFLQMQGRNLVIDPEEYSVNGIDRLLAILYWMVRDATGTSGPHP